MVEMFDAEETNKSESDERNLCNCRINHLANFFLTRESEDDVSGPFGPIGLSYL